MLALRDLDILQPGHAWMLKSRHIGVAAMMQPLIRLRSTPGFRAMGEEFTRRAERQRRARLPPAEQCDRASPMTETACPGPGRNVRFEADTIVLEVADGRFLAVPLMWHPRLHHASPAERIAW